MSIEVRVSDAMPFLTRLGKERICPKNHVIFEQDDAADSLFYVRNGMIKLSVVAQSGKAAIIGVLGTGDFFGEGCLAGQAARTATAMALTTCWITRVEKAAAAGALREQGEFAEMFVRHLLSRNIRMEEDLMDHMFNSSEKRLARVLLLLASFDREPRRRPLIPKISQESLAEMTGTTRSRVSFFMNKFRKQGILTYDGIQVDPSMLSDVLHG